MPDIDYPTGIPDLPLDRLPDVVFEGDTAADFERLCRNVIALCRVVGLPASTDSTGGAAPATGHEGRIAQIAESLAALAGVGGAASLAALVGPLEGDDPATLAGRLNLLRDSLDALPTTAATDALGVRIDAALLRLGGDEDRVEALESRVESFGVDSTGSLDQIGAVFADAPNQVGTSVVCPIGLSGTIDFAEIYSLDPGNAVVSVSYLTLAQLAASGASAATTVCAEAPLTLSSNRVLKDAALTGWNKALTKGDFLVFTLVSASALTSVTAFVESVP